jgi:hypothetical protein
VSAANAFGRDLTLPAGALATAGTTYTVQVAVSKAPQGSGRTVTAAVALTVTDADVAPLTVEGDNQPTLKGLQVTIFSVT